MNWIEWWTKVFWHYRNWLRRFCRDNRRLDRSVVHRRCTGRFRNGIHSAGTLFTSKRQRTPRNHFKTRSQQPKSFTNIRCRIYFNITSYQNLNEFQRSGNVYDCNYRPCGTYWVLWGGDALLLLTKRCTWTRFKWHKLTKVGERNWMADWMTLVRVHLRVNNKVRDKVLVPTGAIHLIGQIGAIVEIIASQGSINAAQLITSKFRRPATIHSISSADGGASCGATSLASAACFVLHSAFYFSLSWTNKP